MSFSRQLRLRDRQLCQGRCERLRLELHIKDHDDGRVTGRDQDETRTMSCPQPSLGSGLGHAPCRNVPSSSVDEKGGRKTNSKLNQSHETTEECLRRDVLSPYTDCSVRAVCCAVLFLENIMLNVLVRYACVDRLDVAIRHRCAAAAKW